MQLLKNLCHDYRQEARTGAGAPEILRFLLFCPVTGYLRNHILERKDRVFVIDAPGGRIAAADPLLREIMPEMGTAAGKSMAVRVLIPVNRRDNIIRRTADLFAKLTQSAVCEIKMLSRHDGEHWED